MPIPELNGKVASPDSRVAVIGLGAAGIAAVIGLRKAGLTNITVFEATANVGGTWVYSENVKAARSSMYKSLHCNIPKESMCYVGRPFQEEAKSFISHQSVAAYLQGIVKEEDILPLVNFNSPVARLFPLEPDTFRTGWAIQTWVGAPGSESYSQDSGHGSLSDPQEFDAVVVCNGHYTVPNQWRPEGAADFPGAISHSHTYRTPERFAGKRVVILGAGPSGADIALELHNAGVDVTLTHKNGAGAGLHGGRVPQAAAVVACSGDGALTLSDGTVLESVDELLLCTGYEFSLPFLSESSGVRVSPDGRAVHGLVKQCLSEKHPTLAFLGMPIMIITFPLFQDQARFVARALTDTLPFEVTPGALRELAAEERKERGERGVAEKYTHYLGPRQWDYRRDLVDCAGGEGPTDCVIEIYDHASDARYNDPAGYRECNYVVLGSESGEWRAIKNVSAEPLGATTDPSKDVAPLS